MNEKYGIYGCPSRIPAKDMDPLLHKVGKEDRKQLLKFYWLDEGHVPPMYILKVLDAAALAQEEEADSISVEPDSDGEE